MIPLGKVAIVLVSAGILAGGVWVVGEKHRLEREIAAKKELIRVEVAARNGSRTAPSRAILPQGSPSQSSDAASPRPAAGFFSSGPAAEPMAIITSAEARDLNDLIDSGLLPRLSWSGQGGNDVKKTIASVAEMLSLSPSETDAVQRAVESSLQAINSDIAASAKVTRRSDDEVFINVKESSQAKIAAITMQDSIRKVLGEQRYGLYEGLGAKTAVDNALNNSGLTATSVTITRTFDDARGTNTYSLRRQNANGSSSSNGTAARESLTNNLGSLSSLLPPEF